MGKVMERYRGKIKGKRILAIVDSILKEIHSSTK